MLTQEYLKSILDYDPETGIFTWKFRPGLIGKQKTFNSKFANKEAGSIDLNGYKRVWIKGHHYYCHRLAFLYVYGEITKYQIDHIDTDTSNNCIKNLRPATRLQNAQNIIKANKDNLSTGLLGASLIKKTGKYRARIKFNNVQYDLGHNFKTAQDAHKAYIAAKRKLHEFCTL